MVRPSVAVDFRLREVRVFRRPEGRSTDAPLSTMRRPTPRRDVIASQTPDCPCILHIIIMCRTPLRKNIPSITIIEFRPLSTLPHRPTRKKKNNTPKDPLNYARAHVLLFYDSKLYWRDYLHNNITVLCVPRYWNNTMRDRFYENICYYDDAVGTYRNIRSTDPNKDVYYTYTYGVYVYQN